METNRVLKIRASGKINLYLNVARDRRPDGYHEIKSIMQSVSLSDDLTFKISKNKEIKQGGPLNGIYISCNNINIPLDEKNLVHKAAAVILDVFNLRNKYKIEINIEKHIPVCAGLAGGSTDAAATLLALSQLFELNIGDQEMLGLAGMVGSDVPFCLKGGTTLAEGRGEILTGLPDFPFLWVVLATNGRKFHTKEIYDKFDLVGIEKRPRHGKLVEYIKNKKFNEFFKNMGNDLEDVAVSEDREISVIKNKASDLGALVTQMTGSGPTIFAFCGDLSTARLILQGIKRFAGEVFLSHTTPDSLVCI
ncbi:MAG: 4-(cytidine 5'-diphospho)-2-C-methyl-D-erythritol kinase [Actinobacteria bacterium]|nr:4-(cytidine 5'-diphospho)-2-C-methyl-D-erythritol kinase [Actinomycetota bacterium]